MSEAAEYYMHGKAYAKAHAKAHAKARGKAHAETTPFGNEVNCWLGC